MQYIEICTVHTSNKKGVKSNESSNCIEQGYWQSKEIIDGYFSNKK